MNWRTSAATTAPYAIQREERLERLRKEYEAQQAIIAKEEDYIRRNIAGQNTRQAQGRRTRLQRLLADGRIAPPRRRRRMTLQWQTRLRSGTLWCCPPPIWRLAIGPTSARDPENGSLRRPCLCGQRRHAARRHRCCSGPRM